MISISGHSLPRPLHVANEMLAFVLEVMMLAGLAWWGGSQHASIGVAGSEHNQSPDQCMSDCRVRFVVRIEDQINFPSAP